MTHKPIFMLLSALTFVLSACGGESPDARYDSGYSDGYAVGFNTTCEIRATLIEGDWDDEHYSSGYRDGYATGALDCQRSRNRDEKTSSQ